LTPFRVEFIPQLCVDAPEIQRHVAHAAGFPRAQRGKHDHPVAVCGGGPSLADHLDELRAWPGDIWAINHTADYLLDSGVDCTLFTVDPLPFQSTAAKRLLATCCHPDLFINLVECFALCEQEEGGIPGGTTTASRAPCLALRLGYPGVVFFGCESSFINADHVDRDDGSVNQLLIRANGKVWRTTPQLMLQAEVLSHLLREFPQAHAQKCGGLLEAMTLDTNWGIEAVSTAVKEAIVSLSGDAGIFDKRYICQPSA